MLDDYDPNLTAFIRDIGNGIYFIFYLLELFLGLSYFAGKKAVEGFVYLGEASVTAYHGIIAGAEVVRDELYAFGDSYVRAVLFVFYAANKVLESIHIVAVDLINFSVHFTESITTTITLGSSFLANLLKGIYTEVPSQVISALSMIGDSSLSCCQSVIAVFADFLAQLVLAPLNVITLIVSIVVDVFLFPVRFISQMPTSSVIGLIVLSFVMFLSRRLLRYNLRRVFSVTGKILVSILSWIVSFCRLTRVKNLIKDSIVRLLSRNTQKVYVQEYVKPTCVVCQEKPVSFMSDTCKHVCLCDVCVHSLVLHDNRCPMCRVRVVKYDRVFIP